MSNQSPLNSTHGRGDLTVQEPILMSPGQALQTLVTLASTSNQKPGLLHGDPGIGKSDLARQLCKELEARQPGTTYHHLDVRAAYFNPVDVTGLPYVVGMGTPTASTAYSIPALLESMERLGPNGVVILDELNRAAGLTQNALMEFSLDRKINGKPIPDGWYVMAAINDHDRALSPMSAALSSRFCNIYVEPDLDDWCQWGATHNVSALTLAFIRLRPELLTQFEKDAHSFPNPRAWTAHDAVFQTLGSPNLALCAGFVGRAAAGEFLAFAELALQAPSIDAILLNPTTADVPAEDQPGLRYVVATGLAQRADAGNLGRVMTYLERLPDEYNVFAVKSLAHRDRTLAGTPEFTQWAIKHTADM